MLLPMYDLLHYNSVFRDIFKRSLASLVDSPATVRSETPYSHALLSLSSYLLTHASSTSSSRALAYAHLALTTLLVVVEDDDIVSALCQPPPPGYPEVRLCRQVCSMSLAGQCVYIKISNELFKREHLTFHFHRRRDPRCVLC
jgi:hypothetical protein